MVRLQQEKGRAVPLRGMTSESYIEGKVRQWCLVNDVLCKKFTPMGENGYPDRIFLFRGKCVFIELKATGKKLRPLQSERLRELRSYGFVAEWHDNVDDAIKTLCTSFFPGNVDKTGAVTGSSGIPARPRTR